MPAINYRELCSRHGYQPTTPAPTTTTAAGVSGAFKGEMTAWALLAIQIMGYCRPLLEFLVLMLVAAGYRRVKRWAKASKKALAPTVAPPTMMRRMVPQEHHQHHHHHHLHFQPPLRRFN